LVIDAASATSLFLMSSKPSFMAKPDISAGWLSRMLALVRNSVVNRPALGSNKTHRDQAVSKLLLKEMVGRKRRNDFVRKREFDMLRKMRHREAIAGLDPGAWPSVFQGSESSRPDDRVKTIKKIDDIEAQMFMPWWKPKHGGAASSGQSVGASPLLLVPTFPPHATVRPCVPLDTKYWS
jgi:hypothetical protein